MNIPAYKNNDEAALPAKRQFLSGEEVREIIDLSVLESFREFQQPGEPDLVGKLIDLFITSTTERIMVIRQAITDGDTAVIKREAHNAKGGAGNIGAHRMAAYCKELEQKASQPDEAAVSTARMEIEFNEVIQVLNLVKQPENDLSAHNQPL